jgi:hypothetical protein
MPDRVSDVAAVLVKYGVVEPTATECARALLLPAIEKRPEHKNVVRWVGKFFQENISDPKIEDALTAELQHALGLTGEVR